MQNRLPRPDAPVFREDAPPPGTDIYHGQTSEGGFITRVVVVDGEMDAEFLAAIMAYTERRDRQRLGRPNLRLLASSA